MKRLSPTHTHTHAFSTKVTYFLYHKQSHPFAHEVFHFLRFFLSFFCATADLKYDTKKHTRRTHVKQKIVASLLFSLEPPSLRVCDYVCVCDCCCCSALVANGFYFFSHNNKTKTYVGAFVSIVREAIDPPVARFLYFFTHIRSSFITANQAISHLGRKSIQTKIVFDAVCELKSNRFEKKIKRFSKWTLWWWKFPSSILEATWNRDVISHHRLLCESAAWKPFTRWSVVLSCTYRCHYSIAQIVWNLVCLSYPSTAHERM